MPKPQLLSKCQASGFLANVYCRFSFRNFQAELVGDGVSDASIEKIRGKACGLDDVGFEKK